MHVRFIRLISCCALPIALLAVVQCGKKKSTEPPAALPGENWTARTTGGLYDLRDIATNGLVLAAVGDSGRIVTSADSGKTWTLRSTPTGANLSGITYLSGIGFVAVSSSGGGDTVLISSTGTGWAVAPTTGITTGLNGIGGNTTTLVAVGCSGSIFSSTNGVSWTPRSSGGVCVRAVERVGLSANEFVAVGDSGLINASTNGLVWPSSVSGVTNNLRGVTGNATKSVVVGDGGIIKSSANATTWVTADSIGTGLNAVSCNGDTFVAVGKSGTVYTSHDAAVTWIQRTSATAKELCGITRVGSTYIAVGLDGTIVTSP